jgi:hypothetical protein
MSTNHSGAQEHSGTFLSFLEHDEETWVVDP